MIESITVRGIATYSTTSSQAMTRLSKLNFVYGCNGAGKTTVSRLVARDALPEGCEVRWSGSGPLQKFVYNRDFVQRSLAQSSQIKGIFTLGSVATETVQRIEELKGEATQIREKIENRKRALNGADGTSGKQGELRDAHASFAETCWVAKRAHDVSLGNAFTGVRGDKTKFRDRLLQEKRTNQASVQSLDYLTQQATSVFSNSDGHEDLLAEPSTANLLSLEDHAIYGKVIVGKEDVDIAAMISRLGNSDWVREGQAFLAANNEICPFCQQRTPATLRSQLDAYFDEAFAADTATLRSLVSSYGAAVSVARQAIEAITRRTSRRIDTSLVSNLLKDLEATWTANGNLLKQKQREPSLRIALTSSGPKVQALLEAISRMNGELQRHNTLVANRASEQTKLTSEVWRYLLDQDLKDATEQYLQKVSNITGAIRGLSEQISTLEQKATTCSRELRSLEQQITSVSPTVEHINGCLDSCGFTGFRLQTASQTGFYRLVRDDGSLVDDTLSEGERSFVAFLYFYHLLRGSESEHGTVGDRVVVIDDPVSSLDSNVLFAVGSLIRDLYDPILNDAGMIRQLILLTHNVYFHKEVTCHPPQGARLKFWVIKKKQGTSFIESKETNPISSSYELLWQELHEENLSATTLQNTMRRILENYFKMTGQVDMNSLTAAFSPRDRQLGRSLLSWTNAGSHNVLDDMHASVDEPTIEHFQEVFKKIFDQTGHGAHYTMMMTRN